MAPLLFWKNSITPEKKEAFTLIKISSLQKYETIT